MEFELKDYSEKDCKKCILSVKNIAFDDMRVIRITRGKYAGEHKIFISEKVFRKTYPEYINSKGTDEIYRHYWEGSKGDWVFTDDSYVIQILDKYTLTNRGYKKSGHKERYGTTEILIFANKMVRIYFRKDGTINAHRFLGCYIPLVAMHMNENYNPLGRYLTERKKHFIILIASGLRPDIAYMKAYHCNYSHAKVKGYRLAMADPEVIRELGKYMKTNLQEDLEKWGLTGDYALSKLKEMIEDDDTSDAVKARLLEGILKIKYSLEQRTSVQPVPPRDANNLEGHPKAGAHSIDNIEIKGKLMAKIKDEKTKTNS